MLLFGNLNVSSPARMPRESWTLKEGERSKDADVAATYVIYLYSLSNILLQEYVLKDSVVGFFCLKVLKLSTKFYNLSLNSYIITAIKINSKNVGWGSSRLPRLTSSKFLFLPSAKSTESNTAEFSDFFSSSSPDKQRISVENSRHVEHLGTPFIRLGPLWPTHNPFSLTIHYFSDILEFTLLCVCVLLWWQAYQPYTTWRGARNRSNPKCVKLLRAQDPVIPELLPRWQVLAPWPLPSPGMQGPERASRGSLGPSPPSPALPWTWTWPHLPAATAFLCQTTSKWGHMECQEMPASPPYKRCLCR